VSAVKHPIVILDFRRFDKNTLCGFCTIRIDPIRLIVHDICLHRRASARWVALPSRPYVRDGQHVIGDDGKPRYLPVLEWEGRKVSEAFSHAVWASVLEKYPELEAEIAA
jgi:hypothetical protein